MGEDREIATLVRASLRDKRPELSQLTVDVENGAVRLTGRVDSFHLRQLAISAARHVAGVHQVVDGIETVRRRSRK